MKRNNLTLLDCTFRDGGYYCDWNFQESIVEKYLKSISQTKEWLKKGLSKSWFSNQLEATEFSCWIQSFEFLSKRNNSQLFQD